MGVSMEFNFTTRKAASEDALLRVAEAVDNANAELDERIKLLSYKVESAWQLIKMQSECIDALNYKTNAIAKEYASVVEATIPLKYRKSFMFNIDQKAKRIDKLYNDVTQSIYKDYGERIEELKKEYGLSQN